MYHCIETRRYPGMLHQRNELAWPFTFSCSKYLSEITIWELNLSNSCPQPTLKIKIRKSTNMGYMGTRIPTNYIFFYHLWHPQPRPLYLACQNFMAEIGSHFQKMKLRGCYLCMRLSVVYTYVIDVESKYLRWKKNLCWFKKDHNYFRKFIHIFINYK